MIGSELVEQGIVREASGPFVRVACKLLRSRLSILSESGKELREMFSYPLGELLGGEEGSKYLEDEGFRTTAKVVLKAADEGRLEAIGCDPEVLKNLVAELKEARGKVKKRALLVPLRLCLTASLKGPDMNLLFEMMSHCDDNIQCEYVPLKQRLEQLRERVEL